MTPRITTRWCKCKGVWQRLCSSGQGPSSHVSTCCRGVGSQRLGGHGARYVMQCRTVYCNRTIERSKEGWLPTDHAVNSYMIHVGCYLWQPGREIHQSQWPRTSSPTTMVGAMTSTSAPCGQLIYRLKHLKHASVLTGRPNVMVTYAIFSD